MNSYCYLCYHKQCLYIVINLCWSNRQADLIKKDQLYFIKLCIVLGGNCIEPFDFSFMVKIEVDNVYNHVTVRLCYDHSAEEYHT